jgi:hypothetical protein
MTNEPHLAEMTGPTLANRSGECLSLFFSEGEVPSSCLTDPSVVGERPAPGHWRLLGIDESRRCAYYARMEHGGDAGCE